VGRLDALSGAGRGEDQTAAMAKRLGKVDWFPLKDKSAAAEEYQ
jgi:hypothetical protein